jgi:hypothetical protein
VKPELIDRTYRAVEKFISWLDGYGETSYDHQSFFAGPLGRKAKTLYYKKPGWGTIAVAPIIFCEALVPSARRFFWRKQRFPIADAHYAMGFAFLYRLLNKKEYYDKSVHFLEELEQTRSPGYQDYCWGYPFDWVTMNGTIAANTPFITTLPYVYEAFLNVYQIDGSQKWLEIAHSIAEHAFHDIYDFQVSPNASACAYMPANKEWGVINASAYRAFLLTDAAIRFSDERYRQVAERNLNFVLQSQQSNGSWFYAADNVRDFVDHFHTCFVLKALAKIEQLTGHEGCTAAIEKGIAYYADNLFDEKGLPKPFSKAPRLTVYRHELYDYAECINLGVLLKNRFPYLDQRVETTLADLFARWQKPAGSYRARKLMLGWDNVPMHRWAQSQVFRSLSFFLYQEK